MSCVAHFSTVGVAQFCIVGNNEQPNELRQQAEGLHAYAGNPRSDMPNGLPFRLTDYLELVDWTGRILRDDKRGGILESTPQILQQLNI